MKRKRRGLTIVFPVDLLRRNAVKYVFASRPGIVLALSLVVAAVVSLLGWNLDDWEVRIAGAVAGVLFVVGNAWHGLGSGGNDTEKVRAWLHSAAGLLGSWFFVATIATADVGFFVKVAAGIACYMMMVLPAMASYWQLVGPKSHDHDRVVLEYYGLVGARAFSETLFLVAVAVAVIVDADPSGIALAFTIVIGVLLGFIIFGCCSLAASFDYRDSADEASKIVIGRILESWSDQRLDSDQRTDGERS